MANNHGPPYDGPRYIGNAHGSVSEQAFYHGSQPMGHSHEPNNHASASMASGVPVLNYPSMMVKKYQVCGYYDAATLATFFSNNSKSFNTMPALNQGPPMPVQSSTKHAPGLSAITRAEADLKSVPPPGDELTRLVEEAKIRTEVAKCHNTAFVRHVDGYWMVPQPCKR